MNIYLDESYNLQKEKGKLFISINGFCVDDDKKLENEWKTYRKMFLKKKRIHAIDSSFEVLRNSTFKLLRKHEAVFVSSYQDIKLLFNKKYWLETGLNIDLVYKELLIKLFSKIDLTTNNDIVVVVDARKIKGGILATKHFNNEIKQSIKKLLSPATKFKYSVVPSYMDILLELADFVSNTFYKKYSKNDVEYFKNYGKNLIQIKNPLK